MKSIVGITMGDPAGIGPEVTVKALAEILPSLTVHPLVIGNAEVIQQNVTDLGLKLKIRKIKNLDNFEYLEDTIAVWDSCDEKLKFELGKTNEMCGEHSFQAVMEGVRLCQSSKLDAIITAPICKESWHLAGHKFDGHTGLIAQLTETTDYRMMFYAEAFSVTLVTTHLPLKDVSSKLTVDVVLKTIELSNLELRKLGKNNPKIAVCGLNPHAGENSIFGNEDKEIILPAIQRAQKAGIDTSGPFPADTIFIRASKGDFDLVIAQYHDQGLIPIKMVAFENAVNLTIGLPIIRTSVDHGTAFDIANKREANHTNMLCAINCASLLSNV